VRRVSEILANGYPYLADVAQASLDIAVEAARDRRADDARGFFRECADVNRRAQHVGQRMGNSLAAEQALPAEHLEKDDAEAPDVGALVHGPAGCLLRAHVSSRAENHPGLRH